MTICDCWLEIYYIYAVLAKPYQDYGINRYLSSSEALTIQGHKNDSLYSSSRDLCRDFSLHNHGDSCFMPCFVWEMPVLVLNLLT